MNAGQYEGLTRLLGQILDRMPERTAPAAPAPERAAQPVHAGPCWSDCNRPEHHRTFTDRTSVTAQADKLAGAVAALAAMERAAKGWADGAAENEEAMGRRDRKPSDEQPFVLADILNMIDDAAREVGVAPVYSERSKKP